MEVKNVMVYDWKITLKKGLVSLGIVFLTGLISIWQKESAYLFLIPAVEMLLNWLKHRKDE